MLFLSRLQAVAATNDSVEIERAFRVRSWSKDAGLPDNRVLSLLQTRDGYLWIGTPFGLARFDGVTLTPFTRGTHPEMPSDHCHTLVEDGEGLLWIGTEQGLLCWDGQQFLRPPVAAGLATGPVTLIAAAKEGGLWLGRGSHLQHSQTEKDWPSSGYPLAMEVRSLAADGTGGVWIGGNGDDLWRKPSPAGALQAVPVPVGLERSAILSLKVLANHSLGAVFRLPDRTDQFATFTAGRWQVAARLRTANNPRCAFFFSDHTGAVWLPDGAAGLVRWREGQMERLGKPWSVAEDFALCGLEDREGNVWIGTESSGLVCLTPKRLATVTANKGLPSAVVRSVWPARAGGIWAGTDNGLSRIGPDLKIITNWLQAAGEPLGKLKSVAELADGTVWFGVDHDQFTLHTGQLTRHHYVRPPGDRSHDDNDTGFNKVRCFLPARDGSLWLAVPRGLHWRRGGEDRRFTTADGLGADDVRVLLETREGTVWAGTAGGGLSRFTGATNRAFATLTRGDGLARDMVWSLLEDADGVVWAGTDGGLSRLEHGRITSFDRRHGLPEDGVNCLLEDDFGHLWIGHERGIYRVSRTELSALAAGQTSRVHCVPFGVADGMVVAECNGQTVTPAACKTADGRLWFATPEGIVVADPGAMQAQDVPPLAALEETRADNEVIFSTAPAMAKGRKLPANSNAITRKEEPAGRIVLPPGRARVLEFHFTALNFAAPEKCRFQYRLDGYDPPDVWRDAGTRRVAFFTNLDPGDYRFQVLVINHHNTRSLVPATFAFSLAPFYWQTAWFWTLVTLAGGGSLTGLVRWRLREKDRVHQLENAQLAAEAALRREHELAEERRRLARLLHDDMGSSLAHLSAFVDRLPPGGEAAATFRLLAELLTRTYRQLKETMWVMDPGDETVAGLADRLAQHLATQISALGLEPRIEPSDLPELRVSLELRRELLAAFKEAVANVVKHAGARVVTLRFEVTAGNVRVCLRDDGCGFDPATPPRASGDGGRGLGNLRVRLASLGGTAVITSAPGQGTEVCFTVPLTPPG